MATSDDKGPVCDRMSSDRVILLNSNGSAMVYLLIMSLFVFALTFSFADTAKLYIDEIQSVRKSRGREFAMYQTQKMLSTTKSLSESARFLPQNEVLRVCLEGGASGSCSENCCQGIVDQGFFFKDPLDTVAQVEMKRNLSGPSGSPVYYKADGSICSYTNGDLSICSYGLTSSFSAQCPGGAANCDHAEYLKIKVFMKPATLFAIIKDKEYISYYFPKVNYPPAMPVIGDQVVTVGTPVAIPLTVDSGHPSEVQDFMFEQCLSGNTGVLTIQCQAFAAGVGQIILQPLVAGTTTVTLQIRDEGLTNNLSKPYSFNVVVNP